MIDDGKVEIAVDVLNDDAEARALFKKMRAEHKVEELRAKAFLAATGPIEERKAKAILDPDHQDAQLKFATASGAHRKAQNERDGAKTLIEVWEQQGHNARALDRIR